MKKIICLIESLGSGGAERQLSYLASQLKQRGYEVEVWTYFPNDFYLYILEEAGVKWRYINNTQSKFRRLFVLWRELVKASPNVVIAYLDSCTTIACMIKCLGAKFKLIVSERNTTQKLVLREKIKFFLYRWADYVVPNSYSQEAFICKSYPNLISKIHTIINFVDVQHFVPCEHSYRRSIIVVATIWPPKNTLGFIKALKILKDRGLVFHVRWFGKVADQSEYYNECANLVNELDMQSHITLYPKSANILLEYQNADIFCLPSFYEGTPNALCEAMSCGLPILCSSVCDNPRYVSEGINGYLFDPNDVYDMAKAIAKVLSLTPEEITYMGRTNRQTALSMFNMETFKEKYLNLIEQ